MHVIKDINELVRDVVRRLRSAMSRRGEAGRKKKRGRKGAKSKAAATRRGLTLKEKSSFVFKHRYLIVKRRDRMSDQERADLATMLSDLPELKALRNFVDRLGMLFEAGQSEALAWTRHAAMQRSGAFLAVPELAAALGMLTPEKFTKMIANKHAEFSSPRVQIDLEENHGRAMSRCLIQDVADAVAAAALAKEEDWSYSLPKFEESPATVGVSLDGTCLLMGENGWRETMVGTLSFYDGEGERQHTIYLAATPEYGKAKFLNHLETEIGRAKARCPHARYVGIADGAKGNWEFLGRHTDVQVTDFWHAAEYLGEAAAVLYRGHPRTREAWRDEACHRLKHEPGGAAWVLKRLRSLARERPWASDDEDVRKAITDFASQSGAGRMDYAARVEANEPIGSGVTEVACKVIVKQRLCGSGMKWTEAGSAVVLSLRALSYTPERWNQFWSKVDRWGFPFAA